MQGSRYIKSTLHYFANAVDTFTIAHYIRTTRRIKTTTCNSNKSLSHLYRLRGRNICLLVEDTDRNIVSGLAMQISANTIYPGQ